MSTRASRSWMKPWGIMMVDESVRTGLADAPAPRSTRSRARPSAPCRADPAALPATSRQALFHQRGGLAHVGPAGDARLQGRHDLAHALRAGGAGLGDGGVDRR